MLVSWLSPTHAVLWHWITGWRQKVFPLHTILEFLFLPMRNKVSRNWGLKQCFIYWGWGREGRLFSSPCLSEWQSHNGHSYSCWSSIHFGNKCCANGTSSSTVTPSYAAMTQAKHMAKIHDILCCFSTPCSWWNLLEYYNQLEAD